MIRTELLTKYYGPRRAVHNVSFSAGDGEIIGFLGLNGAGKTTVLKMLAGLLWPSSGTIQIGGQELKNERPEALRRNIGFLPERPPLYPDMHVREQLLFAYRLRRRDGAERRVDEVIELCGLRNYAYELIRNLSHGYKQRVGIAQAIVHKPTLVILDEPINGLDPLQISEMRTLIRDLKKEHTVLLSSHNLPEIQQTCDRLLIIQNGELAISGTESDIRERFGAQTVLRIEVRGKLEIVNKVFEATKTEGLCQNFELRSEGDQHYVEVLMAKDAPDEIARALIEGGLKLRRLSPQKGQLEELFFQLSENKGT